jgi:hypothetical protein
VLRVSLSEVSMQRTYHLEQPNRAGLANEKVHSPVTSHLVFAQ